MAVSPEELQALLAPREELQAQGLLSPSAFPVILVPFSNPMTIVMEEGTAPKEIETERYAAVIRTDTGRILGIHSPSYGLLENTAAFSTAVPLYQEAGIDIMPDQFDETVYMQGASVERIYSVDQDADTLGYLRRLSENDAAVPEERVVAFMKASLLENLKVVIRNSYDGTWPFSSFLVSKISWDTALINCPVGYRGYSNDESILSTSIKRAPISAFPFFFPPNTVSYGKHRSGLPTRTMQARVTQSVNSVHTLFSHFQSFLNDVSHRQILRALPIPQDEDTWTTMCFDVGRRLITAWIPDIIGQLNVVFLRSLGGLALGNLFVMNSKIFRVSEETQHLVIDKRIRTLTQCLPRSGE